MSNAPVGPEGTSGSENMANSSEHSQRVSSSEALLSSSSASSLALPGAAEGPIRGGPAESSGRGWGDLSGDMQQRLSLGQGQQPRRSSDSSASIPRAYSNERLAPGLLYACCKRFHSCLCSSSLAQHMKEYCYGT